MISERKVGKNINPPCVSCNQKQSPTSVISWNTAPDACEGQNNGTLNNLSLFFSDPASAPSSTQSPARSPTTFPLLLQSPKQKITLVTFLVTNSVPSSPSTPSFQTTGNGQMELVLNEYQVMGRFTMNVPTGITVPFSLFIRMPSQFDSSYQVYIPVWSAPCSPGGTISSTLVQESDGAYAVATVNNLTVGNNVDCSVGFSVVLRKV